jgi:ubiquinone/menaquinone biosynthesis C-methylase UbiE
VSQIGYVHGYGAREQVRLQDQAATLVDLLHHDTFFPPGSRVLEAGCGTGAQTVTIAGNSPEAQFVSVDISATSLTEARGRTEAAGLTNVEFRQGDVFSLPFLPESFDHVFVCFVLEHLRHPADALGSLATLLKPGGTATVIEGDHGSAYFHPDDEQAHAAIRCQIELQRVAGGNALIGRELYPLLIKAGFEKAPPKP